MECMWKDRISRFVVGILLSAACSLVCDICIAGNYHLSTDSVGTPFNDSEMLSLRGGHTIADSLCTNEYPGCALSGCNWDLGLEQYVQEENVYSIYCEIGQTIQNCAHFDSVDPICAEKYKYGSDSTCDPANKVFQGWIKRCNLNPCNYAAGGPDC